MTSQGARGNSSLIEENTNEQVRGATLWAVPAIELSELFPLCDVELLQLAFWMLVDAP